MRRYRFLLSLRWLGMAALGIVLIVACILLGFWQHDRYEYRADVNARIAAGDSEKHPEPVEKVLSAHGGPPADVVWTRVRATGHYDADAQVLIRNRSVNGATGYEVVTPLILADGTAVLVDRGWVAPAASGATKPPKVPAVPSGEVTVTARVRDSEDRLGGMDTVDGVRQARSINVATLSKSLDGPVLHGYLTDDKPPKGLTAIPVEEERAWQNFAYSYQWWLFALMVPIGLAMIARREANPPDANAPKQRKPRWGEERVLAPRQRTGQT